MIAPVTQLEFVPFPPPLPTSGDADSQVREPAVDADGQEIKEDSVVVDVARALHTPSFLSSMLMVSRHAHRPAPSAESMCRAAAAADNLR